MPGVHSLILKRLALHPLRVAAVDDRRAYRGIELVLGALHAARAIERTGAPGPVGIMVPTSAAFPIAALGAWMLGRPIVPLNYLLKRDELQYVIDDSGLECLVSATPMLEHLGYTPNCAHLLKLDELDTKRVPKLRLPSPTPDDDLACLLYTSGTSGRPKGAELTYANLRANVEQILGWVDFSARDVMLGVLPQFHSFGLTVLTHIPLATGMKIVYTARFVPQRIVKLFREHRPTVFVGIPSMYGALLSVKGATPDDFKSLRYAVSGGEPLSDDVAARFKERFGVTIAEGYGMTECSPVTHWCRPQEYHPHSVGLPIPRVEQRIVDIATDAVLPEGEEGELRLRGPNVMRGYHKLPDATAATFDADGFLRTGDMAKIGPAGHLFITGRIKEMLIVGGENVFPREIEEVLESHPSVGASGVVGLRDPVRGEVPIAFIELAEGEAFDEGALKAICRERLAGYKVPREVRVLDELPRNGTGKVLRRKLKDLLAGGAAAG